MSLLTISCIVAAIAVYVLAAELLPRLRRPKTIWDAAEAGNVAVVERLLAQGVSPNVADPDGDTPLHFAETVEVARLLLDHGAELETRDSSGWTPLFWAVAFGNARRRPRILPTGRPSSARAA